MNKPLKSDHAAPETKAKAKAGTVLKAFNGPLRRFAEGYVVSDADGPDLPIPADDLKAKGFIA